MSRRSRTALFGLVFLVITGTASAFFISRALPEPPTTQITAQVITPANRQKGWRNVLLQPEALQVGRRLGKRFGPFSHATSVVSGSLTSDGSEQPLHITRRQTDTGEQIDVVAGGRRLTWSEEEGTKTASGAPADTERLLVERLALDSPNAFVLAQLRGASYLTIARNVRPADAADGYTGPLWNMVRVDEPQQNEAARPLSPWRVYYINVQTGLPDRVEYQLRGKPITAEFFEWIEQREEKTPARVRWSSNGQTLMEFRVTGVSHNQ